MALENKKILFLILPLSGHVHPLLGIAEELVKRKAHLIFYSRREFKNKIFKTGAEFREYSYFDMNINIEQNENNMNNNWVKLKGKIIDNTCAILPDLFNIVISERPDLIVYDTLAIHAQYLLYMINSLYKEGKLNYPAPPTVFFSSVIMTRDGLYPDINLAKKIYGGDLFGDYFKMLEPIKKKIEKLNNMFGLKLSETSSADLILTEKLVLVSVFPELQPRKDLFNDCYKFVGSCISDIYNEEITNKNLKNFLFAFKKLNPLGSCYQETDRFIKLVYVSLGTVFNNSPKVFQTIIDAFKIFDQEEPYYSCQIKSSQIVMIISMGKKLHDEFEKKLINRQDIPKNLVVLPDAPQIEILKRASMFITHCGMNSTSEAIHYAVPVIGLPLDGDQPINCNRVCDDMKLGIGLNYSKLTAEQLRRAMHDIFRDPIYLKNMIDMSQISRKYNGILNASNLIEKFIYENPRKN